jgi:hypothetical protein
MVNYSQIITTSDCPSEKDAPGSLSGFAPLRPSALNAMSVIPSHLTLSHGRVTRDIFIFLIEVIILLFCIYHHTIRLDLVFCAPSRATTKENIDANEQRKQDISPHFCTHTNHKQNLKHGRYA